MQSIERAKELFHELIYEGINVDVIHADKTQQQVGGNDFFLYVFFFIMLDSTCSLTFLSNVVAGKFDSNLLQVLVERFGFACSHDTF